MHIDSKETSSGRQKPHVKSTSKKPFIAKTEERLLEYAAWYYGKYAPSRKMLQSKLLLKSAQGTWVEGVVAKIFTYASDKDNLTLRIENDIRLGISISKIRMKYKTKGFLQEDIESILLIHTDITHDWDIRSRAIRKKMESFLTRGKSRREVLFELLHAFNEHEDQIRTMVSVEYPSDADMLENFYSDERDGVQGESSKKKTFARLVRKGFSYESVKNFLRIS